MTVLGGVCWRPSAWRSRESTITIRVNEVSMIRIAGASVMNVSRPATSSGPAARPPVSILRSSASAVPPIASSISGNMQAAIVANFIALVDMTPVWLT